jgi:hypothetical protein
MGGQAVMMVYPGKPNKILLINTPKIANNYFDILITTKKILFQFIVIFITQN